MKRRNLFIILISLLFSFGLFFTACGEDEQPGSGTEEQTKQLSTPFVEISDTGLASWTAVENATGYMYKIDDGTEMATTALSIQLADGQSIVVKAVGDGANYTDSAYCSSRTYTAISNPGDDTPGTDTPGTDTPGTPGTDTPGTDTPGTDTPGTDTPGTDTPGTDTPGTDTPGTDTPGTDTPGTDTPGTDTPGTDTPGTDTPGTDTPGTDIPGTDTPGTDTPGTPATPTTLGVPFVSIDGNGLATWAAVPNASGYTYKIDNGAEQNTTATSIQLTNGQSIVVKAVGDGTYYLTSAYSASTTFTEGVTTDAPTYLGILASHSAPLETDGLPNFITSPLVATSLDLLSNNMMGGSYLYRPFDEALTERFEDTQNYLGATYPVASAYDIYSAPTNTVYIQIWLDNPNQDTILSLKLNGTKYQVGGATSSFFIEEGGVHYNCVFVAVTIPAGTYTEKTYTVSDIEYISNTYIQADDHMLANNTIKVGLPYEAEMPTVSEFNPTSCTYNSAAATFTLSDDALAAACGGWLGVAVYDNYNIVANQAVTAGSNEVTVTGLLENTYYSVYVYLYGDTHDGNGVSTHTVYQYGFMTQSVFNQETFTVEEVIEYDTEADRYLGKININAEFISPTAQFIKVEVYDDDYENPQLLTTVDDFTGSAKISENILNGQSYNVKIYYKDNEYPDGRCKEESVWVSYLGTAYASDEEFYSVYNDLVFNVTIGNNDQNYAHVNDFTMYVYSERLPSYWAELILDYLANPNIIDELQAQAQEKRDLMYEANASGDYDLGDQYYAEYQQLNDRKSTYENAKYALENRFENNTDTEYWEAEKAKGKYAYTLTYGEGSTDIFKVGKIYYVVLEDFYTLPDWRYYEYEIVAHIDSNDGNGLVETTYDGDFYHTHILTQFNGLRTDNVSFGDNSIEYTFYNQDCYDDAGEYYNTNLGYVWKIEATRGDPYSIGYEKVTLYENASVPAFGTNGDAWLAAYIVAVKAGEDTSGLIAQYVGEYQTSYSATVDFSQLTTHGGWTIHMYTRLYLENYDEDNAYDFDNTHSYVKTVKIATPTVTFEERRVVVNSSDGNNYTAYYNVKDADGNLIVDNQQVDPQFEMQVGYQVQARFTSYEEGLTDSDWSEWVTFEGIKLQVQFNEYDMGSCSVSWYSDIEVSGWVYTLNGGNEVELPVETNMLVLSNGDVLRVKAKAVQDSDYLDSDWAEFTCTDTRTPLATPTNLTFTNEGGTSYLEWTMSNTDGVASYVIYVNGEQLAGYSGHYDANKGVYFTTIYKLTAGAEYCVQAVTEDTENYRNSAFSNTIIAEITLADSTFSSITSTRLTWSNTTSRYVESYWYKVGVNGTEVDNGSSTRVQLADLNLQLGDEVYVQARAENCTPSNWALIYTNSVQLAQPALTQETYGTVSWSSIENATSYSYSINDGETQTTTETSLDVTGYTAGDILRVWATSTTKGYSDSEKSQITVKGKRATPVVSEVSVSTSTWGDETPVTIVWTVANVEDGNYTFRIKINDGEKYNNDWYDGTVTSGTVTFEESLYGVKLNEGDAIEVQFAGNDTYFDSDWGTHSYVDPREALATPTGLTYSETDGLGINFATAGQYGIIYKTAGNETEYDGGNMVIGESGVYYTGISFTAGTTISVKLRDSSGTYKDSAWATYTIPNA